ncbi:MAG: molybdopterin-dependent oxidoreductase [bacterium]|nr:molybdopterin-dependent oxidoreductase [bacterium]
MPAPSDHRSVGAPVPRLDAWGKVTGATRFLPDEPHPDAWLGAAVRSPLPHARLVSVTKTAAFPAQALLLAAADLPCANLVAMVREDLPLLAAEEIRFATQPVALVAAPDRDTLKAALAAVAVELEELPAVLDLDAALRGEGPVWGADNIVAEYRIDRGDPDAVFADAATVVEGTYYTGYQEHMYLEPQGIVATPRPDGGVEILGSLQCPYYIHSAMKRALGLDGDRIVVRQSPTGGAFGGKEDYPSILALQAAVLAMRCGHPVSMIYERREDVACTTKRHPSRTRYRSAFDGEGRLLAVDIDLVLDAGAYTTLSPVVLSRGVLHVAGPYRIPHARIRGRTVATHTPPNGAFRGFGVPQAAFACERQMDRAARRLGLDPAELRRRNLVRDGDTFVFGQTLRPGMAAADLVLERALERSGYAQRKREAREGNERGGALRRGVGVTLCLHGGGFTGDGEDRIKGRAAVRLDPDGAVTLLVSSVEMGQGAATVLPQIAAEALGVPVARIRFHQPDTSAVPDSGPTVASRTTMVVGRILVAACRELMDKARAFAGDKCADPLAAAAHAGLSATATYEPDPDIAWDQAHHHGDAYQGWSWAAAVAEVEVDVDTMEVRPVKLTHVVEIGRAVNPVLCVGQVEGGTLQGLAWGHLEEMKLKDGRYLNDRMSTYIIPTSLDAPDFDVELAELPSPRGPFGAKGLGELPMNAGAPALAAAIEDALTLSGGQGVEVFEAPVTPEILLRRWREVRR